MKINKETIKNAVDYSVESIKHICKTMPPREPGSEGERKSQEYLKNDILSNSWADNAVIEEFEVAPKAFMGFSKIIPVCYLIGLVLFALTAAGITRLAWAPLVMCIIALSTVIGEFLLYKKFLDPFYKKATSSNMQATKKATEETKRRIVFSGHTDAAYEWSVFHKCGSGIFIGGIALALVGAVTAMVLSIVATAGSAKWWQFIVMACFIPGFISLYFFSNYKRVVPGANDDLTGCLTSVAVLKYLKEEGIELKNTDVVVLLTGSEESGLRGAKDWAEKHKKECEEIPTMFIGFDTIRDIDFLCNYTRDLTGTVAHHPEAIALIDKAAEELLGKPLTHASVFLGATDAAAITQAKIPAGSVAAMDPSPAKYYHTRLDTEENLDADCLETGLELALKILEVYDRG